MLRASGLGLHLSYSTTRVLPRQCHPSRALDRPHDRLHSQALSISHRRRKRHAPLLSVGEKSHPGKRQNPSSEENIASSSRLNVAETFSRCSTRDCGEWETPGTKNGSGVLQKTCPVAEVKKGPVPLLSEKAKGKRPEKSKGSITTTARKAVIDDGLLRKSRLASSTLTPPNKFRGFVVPDTYAPRWAYKQQPVGPPVVAVVDSLLGEAEWPPDVPKALRIPRRKLRRATFFEPLIHLGQFTDDGSLDSRDTRARFLLVLAQTPYVDEAWEAYSALLALPADRRREVGDPDIPFAPLRRLGRLLAANRPKTRDQFMRLLAVMRHIQNLGEELKVHEWNALIDNAGKGWRKTGDAEFKLALNVFRDMKMGRPPGTTVSKKDENEELMDVDNGNVNVNMRDTNGGDNNETGGRPGTARLVEPNMFTYNSLLATATRTFHPPFVSLAMSLLKKAGLAPDRLTNITLMQYHGLSGRIDLVRSMLRKMVAKGMYLGIDGANTCIWVFSHNQRVGVAMMVYRLLRHNVVPEPLEAHADLADVAQRLKETESIVVTPDVKPDDITYTLMVQVMSYHGDLMATLSVFMDMLTLGGSDSGTSSFAEDSSELVSAAYPPTVAVYRAIFLGFARHGNPSGGSTNRRHHHRSPLFLNTSELPWSLENLKPLYAKFMELDDEDINQSILQWILVAFDKTSGRDMTLLRQVWKELDEKFHSPWRSPTNRLQKWRRILYPHDS